MVEACLICKTNMEYQAFGDYTEISCPRCTTYKVTGTAFAMLRTKKFTPRQISNISGWLRENPAYEIDSGNLEKLVRIRTPSFLERADKLLLNIEKMTTYAGESLQSDESWLSMAWSINPNELAEIIDFMVSVNRLKCIAQSNSGSRNVKIAPKGWEHLESIRSVNVQSEQAFVAMWFDGAMRSVYDDVISVGIENAGFRPHRVDLREHNEKIDDEIIAQIRKSRFVLADFTGHRGGVYFEAGYAKGLGLEVIWTCREDHADKLHFDIRQYNCILWSQEKLGDFRNKIQYRIEAVLGHGPYKLT